MQPANGIGLRSLIGRRGGRAQRITVNAVITAEKKVLMGFEFSRPILLESLTDWSSLIAPNCRPSLVKSLTAALSRERCGAWSR